MDLSNNSGGDVTLAETFYQLFEEPTTSAIFSAKAGHVSSGNLAFILNQLSEIEEKDTIVLIDLYFQAYKQAQTSQNKITPWVLLRKTEVEQNIFSGPVTILISPNCISACEIFAHQFKIRQRGFILGMPTNGTGFGFISVDEGKTLFRDPFSLYEVEIPNFAFQAVVLPAEQQLMADKKRKGTLIPFDQLPLLENHPTEPDIPYEMTAQDLLDFSDYQKFIEKHLAPTIVP